MLGEIADRFPFLEDIWNALSWLELLGVAFALIAVIVIYVKISSLSQLRTDLMVVSREATKLQVQLTEIRTLMSEVYAALPEDALFDQGRRRFLKISEMWRKAKEIIEERVQSVEGVRAQRKLKKMSRHHYDAILEYLSALKSLDPQVPSTAVDAYRALAATPLRLKNRAETARDEDVEEMRAAFELFSRLMSTPEDQDRDQD